MFLSSLLYTHTHTCFSLSQWAWHLASRFSSPLFETSSTEKIWIWLFPDPRTSTLKWMKCKANCPPEPEGENALKITYTFLLQMCWPFLTSSEHAGKKKKTQPDSTLKPSRPTAHQQPDVQNWPVIALLLLLFCLFGVFCFAFQTTGLTAFRNVQPRYGDCLY